MSTHDRSGSDNPPDWLSSEMPPGYQTRLLEIRRLSEDLKAMDGCGQLLWQIGEPLVDAVHDVFATIGFDVERLPEPNACVAVTLADRRRLLCHVSSSGDATQRKSPELARVFQLVHEAAEATDRVIFVTNVNPTAPPAGREAQVTHEALNLLERLAVNVLTGPTLFGLWRLSLEDKDRAHRFVERLHEQDGGMFLLPAGLAR